MPGVNFEGEGHQNKKQLLPQLHNCTGDMVAARSCCFLHVLHLPQTPGCFITPLLQSISSLTPLKTSGNRKEDKMQPCGTHHKHAFRQDIAHNYYLTTLDHSKMEEPQRSSTNTLLLCFAGTSTTIHVADILGRLKEIKVLIWAPNPSVKEVISQYSQCSQSVVLLRGPS